MIAEIEQFVEIESLVSDRVFLYVNLQPLSRLLQVRESGFAVRANGHDPAGDLHVSPLGLKLRRVARRTRTRIRDDVELWNGNKEAWRTALWGRQSLFGWLLRTHVRHRREWPGRFGGDPRFVRLRSVDEARRWLDALP